MSSTEQTEALVGIVLVTHVDYGASLLRAAEFIMGPQNDCTSISVDASQEVDETLARLKDAVARLGKGKGVLILTDMFGGTPTNLSLSLLDSGVIEVVTGVNLPMLLKVFSNRTLPVAELAASVGEAGSKGIVVAAEMLRARKKG